MSCLNNTQIHMFLLKNVCIIETYIKYIKKLLLLLINEYLFYFLVIFFYFNKMKNKKFPKTPNYLNSLFVVFEFLFYFSMVLKHIMYRSKLLSRVVFVDKVNLIDEC